MISRRYCRFISLLPFNLFLVFSILSAQQEEAVAVLDLEGGGISLIEAASLTDRLRTQLVQTGKVAVIERGRMEQILAEQDFQLAGCTSNECAVEVGQLLGVTSIVAGSIGKVGATFSIDIRVIDVQTGRITRTISRDYRGAIDGLLAEMTPIASELIGREVAPVVVKQREVAPAPPTVFPAVPRRQYPSGRVYLKSGIFIEGKAMRIGSETATITVGGQIMSYNLAEVRQIMAKKGLAKKVGAGCGGCCVGMVLVSTSGMDASTILVGGGFWVAVSYGIGYLIGMLLDQWQVVYIGTA